MLLKQAKEVSERVFIFETLKILETESADITYVPVDTDSENSTRENSPKKRRKKVKRYIKKDQSLDIFDFFCYKIQRKQKKRN